MAQTVEQDTLALDEVVVTARKSSESLINVPLAITAFTAEAIEVRGIANLDDVASLTPGLTFSNVLGDLSSRPRHSWSCAARYLRRAQYGSFL